MKRLINAWLFTVLLSSVYGLAIITNSWMGMFTFFIPMAIFDSLLIWYIQRKPLPEVTDLFIFVLSLSMVNHTFGAVNWMTYNQTDPYDAGRVFIFILEILVITGGGIYRHISGRHPAYSRDRIPGIIHVVEGKRWY